MPIDRYQYSISSRFIFEKNKKKIKKNISDQSGVCIKIELIKIDRNHQQKKNKPKTSCLALLLLFFAMTTYCLRFHQDWFSVIFSISHQRVVVIHNQIIICMYFVSTFLFLFNFLLCFIRQ